MSDWEDKLRRDGLPSVPRGSRHALPWRIEWLNRTATPTSDIEALMMAAPHDEPEIPYSGYTEEMEVALEMLPEEERDAVTVWAKGYSIRTGAKLLGITKDVFEGRRERGLAKLRLGLTSDESSVNSTETVGREGVGE